MWKSIISQINAKGDLKNSWIWQKRKHFLEIFGSQEAVWNCLGYCIFVVDKRKVNNLINQFNFTLLRNIYLRSKNLFTQLLETQFR